MRIYIIIQSILKNKELVLTASIKFHLKYTSALLNSYNMNIVKCF